MRGAFLINFYLDKTLEELESTIWEDPDFPSGLILKCHSLRKKKLVEFTIEDLRVMIGQKISLQYLIPVVLKTLEKNPFVEGNLYKGDLFDQVLRVEQDFWAYHKELRHKLNEIINLVNSKTGRIDTVEVNIEERYILINGFIYIGGALEPKNYCTSCNEGITYT